jgi:hypothetical protein
MEITDFKDFYIDLDGDVKASTNDENSVAKFLTTTEKLSSQYFVAETIEELKEKIQDINYMFDVSDKNLLKQYSIKSDNNGNVVGVKVYGDYSEKNDELEYILIGYDINSLGYEKDFYFMGSVDAVNRFIKKNSLVYEIKKFDTHLPYLYSVKKNENGEIINFKTYYSVIDNVQIYTNKIVPTISLIKQTLKFV